MPEVGCVVPPGGHHACVEAGEVVEAAAQGERHAAQQPQRQLRAQGGQRGQRGPQLGTRLGGWCRGCRYLDIYLVREYCRVGNILQVKSFPELQLRDLSILVLVEYLPALLHPAHAPLAPGAPLLLPVEAEEVHGGLHCIVNNILRNAMAADVEESKLMEIFLDFVPDVLVILENWIGVLQRYLLNVNNGFQRHPIPHKVEC